MAEIKNFNLNNKTQNFFVDIANSFLLERVRMENLVMMEQISQIS